MSWILQVIFDIPTTIKIKLIEQVAKQLKIKPVSFLMSVSFPSKVFTVF